MTLSSTRIADFDPVALIEEGYRYRSNLGAWVADMVEPITRPLDVDELGGIGYVADPAEFTSKAWAPRAQTPPGTQEYALGLQPHQSGLPASKLATLLAAVRRPGIHSAADIVGDTPFLPQQSGGPKPQDSIALSLHTQAGPPALFAVLLRERSRLSDAERRFWRKLCVHLSAACRLSGRGAGPESADVECVLDPDGRVLHATADCQPAATLEALKNAVVRMDRARTRSGRANPESALELWQGLLAGRWSLVEHFESDGRRFILARENTPGVRDFSALPLRQRQVLFYVAAGWANKEVGYALGLSEQTVAVHLRRGLDRLGVRSRAEWIGLSSQVTETAALDAGRSTCAEAQHGQVF